MVTGSAVGRKNSLTSLLQRRVRDMSMTSGDSLLSTSRSRSSAMSNRELEALKLHNEILEMVKYQMWPLDKKLRVLQQAKDYVKKHESEMEERLAQTATCASRLQQFYMLIMRMIGLLWKYVRDFLSDVTPWQQKIKDIESHFGSVVSSYFVFLRWIFWMNFVITLGNISLATLSILVLG